MRIKIVLLLILAGCRSRTEPVVTKELGSIVGEEVKCYQVSTDEGFLCRGKTSGRNYYCAHDPYKDCQFTDRMQLLDVPAEKPK